MLVVPFWGLMLVIVGVEQSQKLNEKLASVSTGGVPVQPLIGSVVSGHPLAGNVRTFDCKINGVPI